MISGVHISRQAANESNRSLSPVFNNLQRYGSTMEGSRARAATFERITRHADEMGDARARRDRVLAARRARL